MAETAGEIVNTDGVAAAREAPSVEEKPYKTEGEQPVSDTSKEGATEQQEPSAVEKTVNTEKPSGEQTAETAAGATDKAKPEPKQKGLFGMCCGGSSQSKNFES